MQRKKKVSSYVLIAQVFNCLAQENGLTDNEVAERTNNRKKTMVNCLAKLRLTGLIVRSENINYSLLTLISRKELSELF